MTMRVHFRRFVNDQSPTYGRIIVKNALFNFQGDREWANLQIIIFSATFANPSFFILKMVILIAVFWWGFRKPPLKRPSNDESAWDEEFSKTFDE